MGGGGDGCVTERLRGDSGNLIIDDRWVRCVQLVYNQWVRVAG